MVPVGVIDRCLGSQWRAGFEAIDSRHYIGCALILSQIYAPLVMVLVGRGMSRLGHAGLDAARLYFGRRARFVWLLRSLFPELIAAGLLIFALALGNFAVPHVLQCPLYPMYIYLRMSNYLDQAGAARASIPLVLLALSATTAFVVLERRHRYVDGGAARSSLARQPRLLTWVFGGALLVFTFFVILLPVGALVYECRSVPHFLGAIGDALPETFTTLSVAGIATVLACGLGLGCGYYYSRPRYLPLTLLTMAPGGASGARDWPGVRPLLSPSTIARCFLAGG